MNKIDLEDIRVKLSNLVTISDSTLACDDRNLTYATLSTVTDVLDTIVRAIDEVV
ncbi:hypothetical protein [Streptococcus danieliae]|uniref:Uncharacterized protein n=1 Tax=Streptococcus danieliae TaxID=747656 RepID=A0A7Z0S4S6_9STRE|nr:hypothetical protein [Streptococcus danieliae]MBF0699156.1 hypothetical protein [Streptococcus danieliae]NYS96332.1 hypothetical protein [Streptococcus danieliae]